MPDLPGGRSISFSLRPSFEEIRGQRLLIVRLSVGQDIAWDMMPNPTLRRSRISPRALDDLTAREGGPLRRGDAVLLQQLRIRGEPIPDLPVLVGASVTRLGVDGILGFDFFEQFEEVRWNPRTQFMVLFFP